jgi:hypothetical protein
MVESLTSLTTKNALRLVTVIIILLLLMPVGLAAISQESAKVAGDKQLRQNSNNITFITTQGGAQQIYPNGGTAVAVKTETKQIVWKHDKYSRYMDIDPIGSNRVLFLAGKPSGDSNQRVAVMMNWRTGQVIKEINVPQDTHDVDYLGNHRYAIADKLKDRVYVYDTSTNSITWEYDFHKHFPASAGGPPKDWTHLNDIDVANNGTAFVVSPRNFDRVMEINRSTKQISWTLGEEDVHKTLYEQHNPVVLQRQPLTILVADSENNRAVEYQYKNGKWKLIWEYRGQLQWPRDADRLPNGNTLIADTHNDRVIEVTPSRHVVWEYHIERGTYDVERLKYGDESAGPTMSSMQNKFESPLDNSKKGSEIPLLSKYSAAFKKLFQIVTWILPGWITFNEFGYLFVATVISIGWVTTEAIVTVPMDRLAQVVPKPKSPSWLVDVGSAILTLLGLGVLLLIPLSGSKTSLYIAVSSLLLIRSVTSQIDQRSFIPPLPDRLQLALTTSLTIVGIAVAIMILLFNIGKLSQTIFALGLSSLLVLAVIDLLKGSSRMF